MNTRKAAAKTLVFVTVLPERSASGVGKAHAAWMLKGISEGYIGDEKAHRWLGYAQAILVQEKLASLADMKRANMRA